MSKQYRGSRKHILELVRRSDFIEVINNLLGDKEISLTDQDKQQPNAASEEEWTLRQFCAQYCRDLFEFDRFDSWWVPDQYKNPTWDLLSTCTIKGYSGLLLVEAKAHEGELHYGGKKLRRSASEQSRKNHETIRRCIKQANKAMNEKYSGFNISIDHCYQLSNRVASAWKLTESGLPTVLLYLGFIGDEYFEDHFVDAEHWQRMMGAYLINVVPLSFPGKTVKFEKEVTLTILIKSLPILSKATSI